MERFPAKPPTAPIQAALPQAPLAAAGLEELKVEIVKNGRGEFFYLQLFVIMNPLTLSHDF
jgi:hypothetical protein